jgi:3-oxoacyl-[acyl-carrier protein] reductase
VTHTQRSRALRRALQRSCSLGPRKITVNAVAPGPVATELFLKGKSDELIAGIVKMAPLGRLGEVSDIVGVVAFLVGREGAWVNGQIIWVNGGYA